MNPLVPLVAGGVVGAVTGAALGRMIARSQGHPEDAIKLSAGLAVSAAILYSVSALATLHDGGKAPSLKQ